jgi:peptidoglycan/xylan/chitin deacetylase (PgdA/CDA1 family)
MPILLLAKRAFLHISKWLGLFTLAHHATKGGLRILCYHGVSLRDEHAFRPQLFVTPGTFRRRMAFLTRHGFPVLPLEEALEKLEHDTLPRGATVITIDDGFYGLYRYGRHVLQEFSLPATLYLTTYYCVKKNPIFRLAVQYMFWKGDGRQRDTTSMWSLIHYGETQCDEQQRCEIARSLGARLGVDYRAIVEERLLSLVNLAEVHEMALSGIDVQLHTHRHRSAADEAAAIKEISDNRAVLKALARKPLHHFCYPSGVWSEKAWLRAAGIKSATTCEPGLNYKGASRYELKRFLDGERISQIEFEAEMCGYAELIRRSRLYGRRLLKRLRRPFTVLSAHSVAIEAATRLIEC